jgi:hypothetical protein
MGAYAQETITVSNTAIGFTSATTNPPNGRDKPYKAVFVVEGDQIRFRVDGGVPTASIGTPANVGDVITITEQHDVENFKAIRVTTDATIQPQYFNEKDY